MNVPFAYFVQLEPIEKSSNIFEELLTRKLYFYYFQIHSNYYFFLYGRKSSSNNLDFFRSAVKIIQELNSKKRQIRSIRGFILYGLEIIKDNKEIQVLKTNFRPLFWERIYDVLKQNRKDILLDFLFQDDNDNSTSEDVGPNIIEQLTILESRIINLENHILQLKTPLISRDKEVKEIIKYKNGVGQEVFDISTENHFKALNTIPEQEVFEIIKTGFELNQKNNISLKDYYEGNNVYNSLLDLKGYSIKYETIRRHKIYKNIKNNL